MLLISHQPHVAVFGHNRPLPVPSLSLSGSLKPQQSTSRDKGPHFSLTSDSKDFHSTSTATRCVPETAGAIDWWSMFVDKHRSGRPTSPYTTIICFSLYLVCCVTAVYKRGTSGLGSLCSCFQRSLLAFSTLLLAVTPSRTQLAHFLQAPENQDLNLKTSEVHKKRQVRFFQITKVLYY